MSQITQERRKEKKCKEAQIGRFFLSQILICQEWMTLMMTMMKPLSAQGCLTDDGDSDEWIKCNFCPRR